MLFTTDQQTLEDLNIFGKHGGDSIYQIYNRTSTRGGALLLKEMFNYPLSDEQAINTRSGVIRYFADIALDFPLQSSYFDAVEPYLENTDERTKLNAQDQSVTRKLTNLIAVDADTTAIEKGVMTLIDLLRSLNSFLSALKIDAGHPYQTDRDAMVHLLADPSFESLIKGGAGKLGHAEIAEFDALFRFRYRDEILKLLRQIYSLDVYCAVAKVAVSREFVFPKALPVGTHEVHLRNVYHPQVKNAVPNSIDITPDSNVIFLTGANMAGKSTFMKSLSIALFLAHMGFPVAASHMEFSVLDGIYTTINLPDNLGMGASHFYAEVLRAKKMATELKTRKLFILFDELFRGTNVKDAGEATVAFTEAFARKKDSIFVISTHIIEAGEILKERCKNISFVYLPTMMDGNQPVYTYKLEKGITEDRHGMVIINNESVLDILGSGPNVEGQVLNIQKSEETGFIADKQTLADLNLLGKYKPNSIYSLFNEVRTAGGERILQEMFQSPLKEPIAINQRSTMFRYFQEHKYGFPFKRQTFEKMESYLGMGTNGNFFAALSTQVYHKFSASFLRDEQYDDLHAGLSATVEILNSFREFLDLTAADAASPYAAEGGRLRKILSDPRLQWLSIEQDKKFFPLFAFARYDYLLKHTLQKQMLQLLNGMYLVDVYLAVSDVARLKNFNYAVAHPATEHIMHTTALRHPGLAKGVANPISFQREQNLLFLTGANMAGKSTFMKAFGIAVYLAHMGFPVAAKDMAFSVLDGIYSSINVADDLNMGHSHFYAEVLRVKHVAAEVASGKNLVVLFDELFKGTNVKDAYDGTLSVTAAFARYSNCFYIVSTHIIEVGEALKQAGGAINFAYLPTVMDGNVPRYTYLLQQGITTDRQGMMIIQNEGILQML
jgi:DNA mismatch repair ATPase MutS